MNMSIMVGKGKTYQNDCVLHKYNHIVRYRNCISHTCSLHGYTQLYPRKLIAQYLS